MPRKALLNMERQGFATCSSPPSYTRAPIGMMTAEVIPGGRRGDQIIAMPPLTWMVWPVT